MFLPHFLPKPPFQSVFANFLPKNMSFPALLHFFAVEPFKLFFALIGGIFQLLLSFTSRNKPKRILNPRKTLNSSNSVRTSSQSRQSKSEIELNGANNIYEEYSIVGEQCLSVNVPPQQYYTNNGAIFNSTRAWIEGRKWEFTVLRNANSQHTLKLALVDLDLQFSSVAAEILFWQWHRGKQICILQKFQKCFQHPGSNIQFQLNGPIGNILPSDGYFNVLIRTLEKRQQSITLPSFDESENVNILVGNECFALSKHYLMSISPVFHKMFTVEMREKRQNEVTLEEIGPVEFKTFLEAISPKQIHPNPYNVHELLKLADRFQCDLLRDRCEEHLVNGVEFPLIERLLCAEIYRLEKLKNYILKSLTGSGLRDFYEENQAALNLLSKDLLIQLTSRICTRSTALLSASIAKGI